MRLWCRRCATAMQRAHRATALPWLLGVPEWFKGKLLLRRMENGGFDL